MEGFINNTNKQINNKYCDFFIWLAFFSSYASYSSKQITQVYLDTSIYTYI